MSSNRPFWLRAMTQPGAWVFAVMFTVESLARSTLATVIPLQAYELLREARDVSVLFFAVAVVGLAAGFAIPLLIRRFRRRWVYSFGVALLIIASALLATGTMAGQVGGMLARTLSGAATNITLMLYVMDYIRRKDLVHSEPLRMSLSAAAWAGGPALTGLLRDRIGPWAPELLSGASAAVLLVYFWYLRIQENPAVAAATRPPPDPIRSIGRFLAQPRLRLAWLIVFTRSSWWAMFYVFPLVYMVQTGVGELAGTLLLSAGNAVLIVAPLIGRLAARFGLRRPIIGAYLVGGGFTMLAGVLFDFPIAVALCLFGAAAFGTMILDSIGGIPFLRSVHPYERPQMTTVFRTYIDMSELVPAGVFSLLLSFFDLNAVFYASGAWMLAMALVARHLPRSM